MAVSICGLIFYLMISRYNLLTPIGLAWIATPFICWLLLPDRPASLQIRQQIWFIPVIFAVTLLCLHGEFDSRLMIWWAQLTLILPAVVLLLLQGAWFRSLSERKGWAGIDEWLNDTTYTLNFLTGCAVVITAASLFLNFQWFFTGWSLIIHTIITLAVAAGVMIRFGLKTESAHYFIAAEVLLWAILGLVRWKFEIAQTLTLGTPLDGYIIMAVGAIAAGFREISRRGQHAFESHFYWMTLIYSLIGWAYLIFLGFNRGEGFSGELSSIYISALSYWLSRTHNRSNLIFTFFFGNIAVALFFWRQDMDNMMLYIVPALGSALVLAHLFKDQLTHNQTKQIRLYCSLAMLCISALYSIGDFNGSIWYPVTAAGIALLGVIIGISLQIRIYLYLGVAFFFINAVGAVGNVIITQPPEHIKLTVGIMFLLTGLLFIGSYIMFQMKRQQILAHYHYWRGEIDNWE